MLMYADDTATVCYIRQNIAKGVIDVEVLKLWEWISDNKLSLNIAKIKYIYKSKQ